MAWQDVQVLQGQGLTAGAAVQQIVCMSVQLETHHQSLCLRSIQQRIWLSRFQVAKANARAKLLLVEPALNLCAQMGQHCCVNLLDVAAPFLAACQVSVLQVK